MAGVEEDADADIDAGSVAFAFLLFFVFLALGVEADALDDAAAGVEAAAGVDALGASAANAVAANKLAIITTINFFIFVNLSMTENRNAIRVNQSVNGFMCLTLTQIEKFSAFLRLFIE